MPPQISLPIRIFRLIVLATLTIMYMTIATIMRMTVYDRWRCSRMTSRLMSWFCRQGLRFLDVEVKKVVAGNVPQAPFFVVSNHLSYIDILVVSSLFPTCYITSVEIGETPGLGQMARSANSLFVERRDKSGLPREIGEITEALRNGLVITIFPEAQTTDGSGLLRFRRPLYRAAINSGVPVIPICLNYRKVGGEPLNLKNRDYLFWYGDMPFGGHIWKLSQFREPFTIEVTVSAPVSPQGVDEAYLAEHTHQIVKGHFSPCTG